MCYSEPSMNFEASMYPTPINGVVGASLAATTSTSVVIPTSSPAPSATTAPVLASSLAPAPSPVPVPSPAPAAAPAISTGAIIAIAICGSAVILGAFLLVYFIRRHRRARLDRLTLLEHQAEQRPTISQWSQSIPSPKPDATEVESTVKGTVSKWRPAQV
jgi:hypothetical protein